MSNGNEVIKKWKDKCFKTRLDVRYSGLQYTMFVKLAGYIFMYILIYIVMKLNHAKPLISIKLYIIFTHPFLSKESFSE
jgi:hypothetical protein